ncbi:hypothetical protein FA15DRAFT_661226 [Coprinopsis marcescibilis]|uniref:Uncharacterized protein n=1 Tax=Coprinopsis marcescibilis TaxID=230819 RepID=A0A5C3KCS4_COPMA|nr:hypothetical protein FA15DRAFT_661226 [Coprinopsis marcescibilis]
MSQTSKPIVDLTVSLATGVKGKSLPDHLQTLSLHVEWAYKGPILHMARHTIPEYLQNYLLNAEVLLQMLSQMEKAFRNLPPFVKFVAAPRWGSSFDVLHSPAIQRRVLTELANTSPRLKTVDFGRGKWIKDSKDPGIVDTTVCSVCSRKGFLFPFP